MATQSRSQHDDLTLIHIHATQLRPNGSRFIYRFHLPLRFFTLVPDSTEISVYIDTASETSCLGFKTFEISSFSTWSEQMLGSEQRITQSKTREQTEETKYELHNVRRTDAIGQLLVELTSWSFPPACCEGYHARALHEVGLRARKSVRNHAG